LFQDIAYCCGQRATSSRDLIVRLCRCKGLYLTSDLSVSLQIWQDLSEVGPSEVSNGGPRHGDLAEGSDDPCVCGFAQGSCDGLKRQVMEVSDRLGLSSQCPMQ
jgi:hypothetical protein